MKFITFVIVSLLSIPLFAAVETGQVAPAFTLEDIEGNTVSLSEFAGKTVVLEWVNPGCPFVRKFYDNQDMPAFQKAAAEMGVVWLSINSTNPGHKDYLTNAAAASWASEHGFAATWLVDSDGKVGQAYGARTTPHMFIIDAEGKIAYQGAIDSVRDAKPSSIAGATNYVMDALKALDAGEPVSDAQTRPYGCSVKY
ncbi:thioredoxin family protein [Puniceicoccales bacterium CK1056]|uniref:Thioredoxin family protein n=1 Tax=Oceanipulchritudo coccoides TaxID=2706888 RepID=A0A6B2M2X4_9BACT|nr:thioredoxin family protein [Oceanipulchritudo coccoides]NDV62756.1 thioredoxin family protein [Oceanipulchritudo coccoides]